MSFVRPDAMAQVMRWRDVLIAAGFAALGIWMFATKLGVPKVAGAILFLAAMALAWTGVRRARFIGKGDGPGVVELDERQINYFGPMGGGSLAVEALQRITIQTGLDRAKQPQRYWLLEGLNGDTLRIPSSAKNAQALFDAVTALNGVNYDQAIKALQATSTDQFLVWQKDKRRLH
ncbi:hypothetical protein [Algirhabdus cladophorae]|uniref:hypothetical protein n=1 Tax=Algirhabdus cladophorae TaxID=3377108 RepID=UPI003B84B27D